MLYFATASRRRCLAAICVLACLPAAHAEVAQTTLLESGRVLDSTLTELAKGDSVKLTETFHFNNFEITKTDPVDGLYNYRFSFEIDGVLVAGVHTIDGLESESDIVEYKDGEDSVSHTRPGKHKPAKMSVHKDWSNTSEWYKWRFSGAGNHGFSGNENAESFAEYFGQLEFTSNILTLSDDAGNFAHVEITSTQAVPEPASSAALVIGAMGLVRKARRTRRG